MKRSFQTFAFVAGLSLALGFVGQSPGAETTIQVLATPGPQVAGPESGPDPSLSAVAVPTATRIARQGLSCAPGKNGGATAPGVTATEVKLAATVVLDGPAASLLKHSPTGMKAVVDKVNSRGGICGRRLSLKLVNDGFDARLGNQFIGNFIAEDYFALAVVPSAEGLSSAISSGAIRRAGIPVVGTDGMRAEQYTDPWVWPVATATVSTMRIIAKYAREKRAARTFAIVWDGKYKFGIEGAEAFKSQVSDLGGTIVADVKVDPEQPSYASEVAEFNRKCGDQKCDAVIMLLLPETAKNWLDRSPEMGRVYTAGAQTLFTQEFAQDCVKAASSACHGLAVWTGYNPPIPPFHGLPDVATYVNDVTTVRPGIDTKNQFLEGAYLGMTLFVEALRLTGPDLTRENLRATLDSMSFRTDFTSPLRWRPGKHDANTRARAFAMVVSGGQFRGWRDEGTGWVADPKGGVS